MYNDNLWHQWKYMKISKRKKKLRDKIQRYLAMSGCSVSRHIDKELDL